MSNISDIFEKINNYFYADKRVFAKGICKEKLFLIFIFGCLFGCAYEEILNLIVTYNSTGVWSYVTRRGLIYGELSPIYGWGATLFVYVLLRKKRKWYINFLYGSLIGGVFEYLISFLQETFTGSISWDYSNLFLNINGRTTITFMIVWGVLALIMIYIFYPVLYKKKKKIPYNLGMIIYYSLLIFVIVDMFLSFGAVIRQGLRHNGIQPISPLGKIFDCIYSDERLARVYTNAVMVK